MTEIQLGIQGGGQLQVHGSLESRRLMVVLSRDQFMLDDLLMAKLVERFVSRNLTVVRYEPAIAVTTRLISHSCFHGWPQPVRQVMKALFLLLHPTHWRHFSKAHRETQNAMGFRTRALTELVTFLGRDKEIILLTRSAGGRVASLVSDQLGISKLICLGYPFENPQEGPNPARYTHLETMQTPTLILQGARDNYGGIETAGNYQLGPHIVIEWVDTDHEFRTTEAEWQRIMGRIDNFIRGGAPGTPGE